MPSVKVGPEFFAKARNDYRDWRWALIREFAQNSIDAGCSKLTFAITLEENKTTLRVTNDGNPMTQDVLTNKLLSLGSSGKSFANGAVGGFGKAKELLYFTHLNYHIHSGENIVNGCGGDYEFAIGEYFEGTESTILINGDHSQELADAVKRFALYAQCDPDIELITSEGTDLYTPNLKKGAPRRELDFGIVYTNKSFQNVLVVRIGGIPMFKSYCELDRCVILELNGKSSDVLTSNRDGLRGSYQEALNSFLTELAVDKKSALKNKGAKYRHYSGARYGHHTQKALNVKALVGSGGGTIVATGGRPTIINDPAGIAAFAGGATVIGEVNHDLEARVATVVGESAPYAGNYVVRTHEEAAPASMISEELIVKNETDLAVPKYYLPDSGEFCSYAQKLVKIWGRLLLEMHRLFDHEDSFAVGFVFDEDSEAQHENGDYGRVYYLNPAIVVKQDNSESRSFKKRFKLTERGRLIAIAAHEFVHGLGFKHHSEDYACKYTDVMGRVLTHASRFAWCFK